MAGGNNLEQIYHQTANLIYDLFYRYRISEEEKVFLLNLLEMTFYKKDKPQLLEVLKRWNDGFNDSELDQIIKATLLAADWSDEQSFLFNTQVIADLIDAREQMDNEGENTGGDENE
ncbi:MAG TPA: hypothetical protein PKN87_09900 [Syntrophomonadaceae bacterium]|nr:hypothetical protein [Syntrophomonadaceae bacterium]HNX29701.1 hypothetical protein [Syntrophomonadaceae bacterium]HPR92959.1 hypothetical protein [Syntrophomonadaceae bacterium]